MYCNGFPVVQNFIKRTLLLRRNHLLEIMCFLQYWTQCGNICPTFLFPWAVICFCLMGTRSCMLGSKEKTHGELFLIEFAKVAELGPRSRHWDSQCSITAWIFFFFPFKLQALNTYILSLNQPIFTGNCYVLVFDSCWEYRVEQERGCILVTSYLKGARKEK